MKEFRSRENELDLSFFDDYESNPNRLHAKQMTEEFSLDGCEYAAGDYLGVGGVRYSPDNPVAIGLFAMPKSMFEGLYRRSEKAYISRLEAAYLKEKADWEYRYDPFLSEEGAMQIAKEALERIKAGEEATE